MAGNSCHEFFKVYLSKLSSKKLGLPPAFVSTLGRKIPKNCTIKDSNGKIWQVKLEANTAGLVVGNGWEELASHHSLDDGDFLVFDYDGNSQFGVKIYGTNGLQKRKDPEAVASTSPAKKQRQQGQEERSNSLPLRPRAQGHKTRNLETRHEDFSVKLNQSRPHDAMPCKAEEAASNFTSAYPYFKAVMTSRSLVGDLSVPRNFVKDHIKPKMEHNNQQIKMLPETKLVVANGKWSVNLIIYFKHGSYGKLSAGWVRFVRDNCLEMGDECFFELINNDPVIMNVSIFKHNDVVPPKAEEADITTSSYPYFKAVMGPGYLVSSMTVPAKFVMNHIKPNMQHEQLVTKVIDAHLLVGDNKWIVGLIVYFKHRGRGLLSVGWRKFVRDNCLEVGDECLFELINNDPLTMKVSILSIIE